MHVIVRPRELSAEDVVDDSAVIQLVLRPSHDRARTRSAQPSPSQLRPTLVRRAALVIVASTAPARPPNHAAIAPRRSAIEANRAPRDTDLAATSAAWVVTRSRASISFWSCPGHRINTPRMRGDSDAPHMSPVTPAEEARRILLNKVSWKAFCLGLILPIQLLMEPVRSCAWLSRARIQGVRATPHGET
jgi:hypothetical protein